MSLLLFERNGRANSNHEILYVHNITIKSIADERFCKRLNKIAKHFILTKEKKRNIFFVKGIINTIHARKNVSSAM